ncbi:MAG: hypothetical protein ACE5K0_04025 [Candidatus Methanofastidiosia archaeon]
MRAYLPILILGLALCAYGALNSQAKTTLELANFFCPECLGLQNDSSYYEGIESNFTEGIDLLGNETINTLKFLQIQKRTSKKIKLVVVYEEISSEYLYALEMVEEFSKLANFIDYDSMTFEDLQKLGLEIEMKDGLVILVLDENDLLLANLGILNLEDSILEVIKEVIS